ncbi:MAG: class I SAM-dependent methyltransferase [Candidatus Eiseniibacteriota bacterium]
MTRMTATTPDAFADRLLESARGAFEILTMYIGVRLGYYDALADGKALTSTELATATRTVERYAREWLEQQTVAGFLEVEDERAEPKSRRFRLPPGHAEVLTQTESLNYYAPLARLVVGAASPIERVLEAYRKGGGVRYGDYGPDVIEGQAGVNRAMFLQQLGGEWLPAIPDVHARLSSDPPARVADVGCGAGWSSIGMALSYPKIRVDGFDLDEASADLAKANAAAAGLGDRVSFAVRDAGDPKLAGQYDLAIALECLHDMAQPVSALRAMRQLTGDRGAVVIVDERVGETFTAEGTGVEWLMYGWSVLHCLPAGMADTPSAETGTVMRPETLRRYAREAGFRELEILPIDHLFFRFYRLRA